MVPAIAERILFGAAVVGLRLVETNLWGGLFLTLVISHRGHRRRLPLGVLLALGRRSEMPIIKALCVALIEIVRGVPLVTVLFMASVMLPCSSRPGWSVDKLTRALIGVALFAAPTWPKSSGAGFRPFRRGSTRLQRRWA